MKHIPVGKRTRHQQDLKEKELREANKRARVARLAERRITRRVRSRNVDSMESDDDEEVKVVDVTEYNRRIAALRSVSPTEDMVVERNQDLCVSPRNDNENCDANDCHGHVDDHAEEGEDIGNDNVNNTLNESHEHVHDHGEESKDIGTYPDYAEESKDFGTYPDHGEESKDFGNDNVNGEDSDESLIIIGERWDPLAMVASADGSQSSDLSLDSDSDGETTSIYKEGSKAESCRENVSVACHISSEFESSPSGEDKKESSDTVDHNDVGRDAEGGGGDVHGIRWDYKVGHRRKNRQRVSGSESSSSGEEVKETNEKDDGNHIGSDAEGGGGGDNGIRLVNKAGRSRKNRKTLSDSEFRRRMFDGLIFAAEPDNDAPLDNFVGRRTRSHCKLQAPRNKIRDGTIRRPVTIDVEESSLFSSHDEDDNSERTNVTEPQNVTGSEYGGKRKRGRPPRNSNVVEKSKHVNDGKLKRGRPRKDRDMEIEFNSQKKHLIRRLKTSVLEKILLNTILDNGKAGLEGLIPSVGDKYHPRKFCFGNLLPEKSVEDQELERLFEDLDSALRVCDIGTRTSCLDKNDEARSSAISQGKLCSEGKHYLIHDDEIGIRCKFCAFVQLEIRHVMPDFNKDPFGKAENRNCGRLPDDNVTISGGFQFPEMSYGPQASGLDDRWETVWDLIPGVKRNLYPHQQEGFEFIWRNVGGGINREEFGKRTESDLGGCIVCHAPGTGKTRLAITFLQSFLKYDPKSMPVIIAPCSMLLTWEEQFATWEVDIPFLNLNKDELSGREDLEVLRYAENLKDINVIRMLKLYTWSKGKGILGISYRLFETLAGEGKGTNEDMRQVLLKKPRILVLDEGHTPRNDNSNIWNVLSEVDTKRKIILSGTPFQNNFEELQNTLSLVREGFGKVIRQQHYVKKGRKSNSTKRRGFTDCKDEIKKIVGLKKRMEPFVHVYKGEILRKTLRGLFHSVLFLKPSDLQKTCFKHLAGIKSSLKLEHLLSIVSVHPSILNMCQGVPDLVDKSLLERHKTDLDAGTKIRFLFELIHLTKGEKVLVFSQFLHPLRFIGDLLKSHFCWTDGVELLYMDGKQEAKQKQSSIRHFNDPRSEARVLLASTKACCEGIHLVGASRVVLLDVVWNPSVERQAISRAYRIGQQKDVFVYHLITSNTQEGGKYCRQMTKDRLSELIFSSSEGESKQNMCTLSSASEDRVLEEMVQHVKTKYMFEKVFYQPKNENKLIESL